MASDEPNFESHESVDPRWSVSVELDALYQLLARATSLRAAYRELEQPTREPLLGLLELHGRELAHLRDRLVALRCRSFGEFADGLGRICERTARPAGPRGRLVIRGREVAVEAVILERLKDPLLRVMLDAIRGAEPEATRVARGKPPRVTLTCSASASDERVLLDIDDDGAGEGLSYVSTQDYPRPQSAARTSSRCLSDEGVRDHLIALVREFSGTLEVDARPGLGTRRRFEFPRLLAVAQ